MATSIEDSDVAELAKANRRQVSVMVAILNNVKPQDTWFSWSTLKATEEQATFSRLFEAGHTKPNSLSYAYVRWEMDRQLWTSFFAQLPFPHSLHDEPSKDLGSCKICHRGFDDYCQARLAEEETKNAVKVKEEDIEEVTVVAVENEIRATSGPQITTTVARLSIRLPSLRPLPPHCQSPPRFFRNLALGLNYSDAPGACRKRRVTQTSEYLPILDL
jgi:hypothetical protein